VDVARRIATFPTSHLPTIPLPDFHFQS